MSDILKSASEVRKLSNMFRALADIGPALELVGSLEQAEREARSRIEKILSEEANAKERLQDAVLQTESAEIEAKRVVDLAREHADSLLASANEDAEDIRAIAKAKAERALLDANADVAVAQDQVRELKAEAKEAEERIAAAEKKLAALKEAIATIAKM